MTAYYCPIPESQRVLAKHNVHDIVYRAIEHTNDEPALIVHDAECPLAEVLKEAYAQALPMAEVMNVAQFSNDEVMSAFAALPAGALVVLVQSTHFRLDAYRLRVQLFNQGLKVIEHVHLARMVDEQALLYIDALAYDPEYYRGTGAAIKAKIDAAASARLCSGEQDVLYFDSALELAKMNVGDYRQLNNVGGQFPIGEVFTEARDLEAVHGRAQVFVFGDTTFHCNWTETPITLIIEAGRVVSVENSTPHFDDVLAKIREVEGEVWVRELGLGMNRAFSPTRKVSDIGTFERMCGVHLSLGAKHGSYTKPQFKRKDTRFHVDVMIAATAVYMDDVNIFKQGEWVV
ncbi:hypothetical protein [Hydromonas duriensis]|uniref:Leucyl aminopeptidase (Aminopeptidase T) n=1 Tax=Hydromonas duriensis TaxID=1527608 RepID=A0A4R6Y817_9BURK|nr:hypothetical protein [Hydromonas duriensis]TDR31516.1 hypothetical protein DFR44_10933 [Hydromonas duriensis]